MRGTIKVLIHIGALGVMIATGWFLAMNHRSNRPVHKAIQEDRMKMSCLTNRGALSQFEQLAPRDIDALKQQFAQCIQAYSNRQAKVLAKLFKKIPLDQVKRLSQRQFIDLTRSFNIVIFDQEFFFENCESGRKRQLKDFPDVPSFHDYVESLFEVVKMLGEFDCQREDYERAAMLEVKTLYHLRLFRKKYEAEVKDGFLNCTDQLMADWIGQIESENGFCRRCLHDLYRLNLHLVECGEVKREDMLRLVRIKSSAMLKRMCDYVPKWIDEIK